eukprot:4160203-Amphidinium_carterae.1
MWASTVESVASQLWTTDLGWREQLAMLERIMHDAASEVRGKRNVVCKTNHRQVLALCLRALRQLEAGDLAEVKRLCSMAPHLRLGPSSRDHHGAREYSSSASASSSFAPSRSMWASRIWRAWKNMKILPDIDVTSATGNLCTCRAEEVDGSGLLDTTLAGDFSELAQHTWRCCLARVAYVPRIDWCMELTVNDLVPIILNAPNTAVGPDCIPYRAYAPIAERVANVLCVVADGCRERVSLPEPKKPVGPLNASEFRPLAMLNTLGKLLARAIADQLTQRLPAVIHEKQCGFISGRGM